MVNGRTAEILDELEAVLNASTLLDAVYVSLPVTPIVQEVVGAAAYIQLIKAIPRLSAPSPEMDGYDFHGMFLITLNVDCTGNKNLVYDVVDGVQRAILNDSAIWSKLIDRDLIAVEYDNAEFSPKRVATFVLEVQYRLSCN
jgi:hypothetical protein